MLVNITINFICKFHINTGHFIIVHCNLSLVTKYLFDKLYYCHQPKEVRLEIFTTATVHVHVLWDVMPYNWTVKYRLL